MCIVHNNVKLLYWHRKWASILRLLLTPYTRYFYHISRNDMERMKIHFRKKKYKPNIELETLPEWDSNHPMYCVRYKT